MNPEVTIAHVSGGYLVHTSRKDGDDTVHDPHVEMTLGGAIEYISDYFNRHERQDAPENLNRHIL